MKENGRQVIGYLVNLQELRERLGKGFYLDNLYVMARLCKSLALDTASPAPFFVMEKVFLSVADHWEDRPLRVEEAKEVESKMIGSLEELIRGIESNASSQETFGLLNGVVSAYLTSIV